MSYLQLFFTKNIYDGKPPVKRLTEIYATVYLRVIWEMETDRSKAKCDCLNLLNQAMGRETSRTKFTESKILRKLDC